MMFSLFILIFLRFALARLLRWFFSSPRYLLLLLSLSTFILSLEKRFWMVCKIPKLFFCLCRCALTLRFQKKKYDSSDYNGKSIGSWSTTKLSICTDCVFSFLVMNTFLLKWLKRKYDHSHSFFARKTDREKDVFDQRFIWKLKK